MEECCWDCNFREPSYHLFLQGQAHSFWGSHSSSPLLVLSVNILSLTRLNMRGVEEGEDGIDAGTSTSVFFIQMGKINGVISLTKHGE